MIQISVVFTEAKERPQMMAKRRRLACTKSVASRGYQCREPAAQEAKPPFLIEWDLFKRVRVQPGIYITKLSRESAEDWQWSTRREAPNAKGRLGREGERRALT